ncbi:MAG TPA: DUF421 domain-containing protein [Candidatus Atribacteria bacterium]|nr:DUF421 domain-containing protein [Candidatus Atribacteria bacterium]
MLVSFVRALILYAVVVLVVRIMGKRQIAQLQPFELVVAIMIADLAAVPAQNVGIPLVSGLVPIFALLLSQLVLSFLTMKSERIRVFVCGSPTILIENGKINYDLLKKQRINLNDLLEQLRSKNVPNVSDVEFAILETGGQLNVIPKSTRRPVTPGDLGLPAPYEGLPLTLIMDGQIHHENIRKANLDMAWLMNELNVRKLSARDVFFAYLDSSGNLKIQARTEGGGK